jgi:hypothetical protein
MSTPKEKINLFRKAVQTFVFDRPQEFVKWLSFRGHEVDNDSGFVGYALTVKSRNSWQRRSAVLESKADLACFCSEVQRKLGIHFTSTTTEDKFRRESLISPITSRQQNSGAGRRRESDLVFSVDGNGSSCKLGVTPTSELEGMFEPKKMR